LAALDLGTGVEQPFGCLIVQNHQAMQSMRRTVEWTLKDNMVDGLFFYPTLTGRSGGLITHLYKHEPKRLTPVWRWLSWTQALLGRAIPGVGAGVRDENAESCGVDRPIRIPLVICPMRRMYVVNVRGTDGLLCSKYTWVSRFEVPCICTRWTGER